MTRIERFLCIYFLLNLFSTLLIAQPIFTEGTITYRTDTLQRTEDDWGGVYNIEYMNMYKKEGLTRLEMKRTNRLNKSDVELYIQIRNKAGIYVIKESSIPSNLALFLSYDDEKKFMKERLLSGYSTRYFIDKLICKTNFLNIPAEKVILKKNGSNQTREAIVTKSIAMPVAPFFESFHDLQQTPLQFIDGEYGRLTRFTAVKIDDKELPDSLFQVESKFRILTIDERMNEIMNYKR